MTSEHLNRQSRPPAKIALHTLGGILIGLLVVSIPFSIACESPAGLQVTQIVTAIGFTAFCGIISAIGGEKMLDRIAEMATNLSF
jgi:hypothetical protein